MMLEATQHPDSSFVTLTYSDEHLSVSKSTTLPTLDPTHLKNFLKRLRTAIAPHKLRFFASGEYGDETSRPHYHAILFNYPPCAFGRTRQHKSYCCAHCDQIERSWGYGNICLGGFSQESASYVAGYVIKKLTSKGDPRLNGRHPEFSRMSRKPGIGFGFMDEVASTILSLPDGGESLVDVPTTLQHGTRVLPLGRYLTRRLRKLTGRDEKAPQEKLDAIKEELRPLREVAFDNSRSFKEEVVRDGDQAVLNAETKSKIFGQKRRTL